MSENTGWSSGDDRGIWKSMEKATKSLIHHWADVHRIYELVPCNSRRICDLFQPEEKYSSKRDHRVKDPGKKQYKTTEETSWVKTLGVRIKKKISAAAYQPRPSHQMKGSGAIIFVRSKRVDRSDGTSKGWNEGMTQESWIVNRLVVCTE